MMPKGRYTKNQYKGHLFFGLIVKNNYKGSKRNLKEDIENWLAWTAKFYDRNQHFPDSGSIFADFELLLRKGESVDTALNILFGDPEEQ